MATADNVLDQLIDLIAERVASKINMNGNTPHAADDTTEKHTEESLSELGRDALKALAEEYEVTFSPKTRDATLIAAILEAQEEAEEQEKEVPDDDSTEEDEEGVDIDALAKAADDDEDAEAQDQLSELAGEFDLDPDDYDTWAALADAIGEASEAGDNGEGGEFWTKEELDPKTIGELKAIAAEGDIDTKGLTKAAVIKAILSA